MTPEELRRARRAFVRSAHPDRGGDAAAFTSGLAEYDRRLRACTRPPRPTAPGRVVVVRRATGLARLRRLVRFRPPRRPRRVD